MERVPAQHAGLFRGQRAVPVRPAAAAALPAAVRRAAHGQRAAGHGLEHRRLVRHQHELAELLRRVHHDLPGPDGRPRGAELHVGRGRHRDRHRADPRVHPVPDRQAGQLLGGRDPLRVPAAAPAGRHRRHCPDGRRRDRQLRQLPHAHHPVRRAPDHGRRPGRLAGSHQGHGEQRGRLLQRQLRAPLREPEPVHELVRDLPAAAHPVRHAARVRQDGRRQPAGLRAGRGHGDHLDGGRRRHQLLRDAGRRDGHRTSRTAPRRATRSRFGTPGSLAVRGLDHGHLHRGGELLP